MKKTNIIRYIIASVVLSASCLQLQAAEDELVVSSFNVRNDTNTSDAAAGNGWSKRYPHIANMILFHDLDIIGTQECVEHQVQNLLSCMPGYNYIGVGRNDGGTSGEYSAIFYKEDKFELIDTGNFWLSDTPDVPGKGWDADQTRICTWGHFRVISTGFEFFFFNLHLDHRGANSRIYSAELVLYKIEELAKNQPVIVTGDFNLTQFSDSYKVLEESCIVKDSYNLAGIRYAPNGTMSDFNINNTTIGRIDHIFVTPDQLEVKRYGILTDNYWDNPNEGQEGTTSGNFPENIEYKETKARTLSDHFPVVSVLKYEVE